MKYVYVAKQFDCVYTLQFYIQEQLREYDPHKNGSISNYLNNLPNNYEIMNVVDAFNRIKKVHNNSVILLNNHPITLMRLHKFLKGYNDDKK